MTDPTPLELRRRAESLVQQRVAPVPTLEGDRLLHELQVHQIELELQNEQLTETCAELSALRDRYCDLYDFAPVAYFTVGAGGLLTELNQAGARLLGREREALVGDRLAQFVHESSREAFAAFADRALTGVAQVEETLVVQPEGAAPVYVRAQARLFANGGAGPCLRVVMMDVSALKTANDNLLHSFETFFRYWQP